MAYFPFDPSQITLPPEIEPVPAGRYVAVITASDFQPNRAGTGSYLKLEFTIIGGEFKNRKVWTNLNLIHTNQQVVGIALRDLTHICNALGIPKFTDSNELHNKPIVIRVRLFNDTVYGPTNDIVGYEKYQSPNAVPQPAPVMPQPAVPRPMQTNMGQPQATLPTLPTQPPVNPAAALVNKAAAVLGVPPIPETPPVYDPNQIPF